jgi:hypothetical protein
MVDEPAFALDQCIEQSFNPYLVPFHRRLPEK